MTGSGLRTDVADVGDATRRRLLGASAVAVVGGVGITLLGDPESALASNPTQYNVQASPYNAKGDGATDDTTSIQSAINAANTAGGGVVFFPHGTYITRTLTLYSNIVLQGAGYGASTLKLKASANQDVVQGANFSTLTGGGTQGGISQFGLTDISIDGNKANNTSGFGLRVYGFDYFLRDVRVGNCAQDGIYSEWGTGSLTAPSDQMEAHVTGVKSHDNGANGITWKGPHDSVMTNVHTFDNATYGLQTTGNGQGVQLTNGHSWGTSQTNAYYLGANGAALVNVQAEGSTGAQIVIAAHDCQIIGANVYNGYTATQKGIQMGVAGADAGGCRVEAYVHACKDGALNFVNESGNNDIRLLIIPVSGGTPINGYPASSTRVETVCIGGGSGAGSWNLVPVDAGSGTAFRVVSSTSDLFNINASVPSVELVNGTGLRCWSGNYSSETVFIDGSAGTVRLGGSSGPTVRAGSGSPNSVVSAPVGSLYMRTDGGAGSTLYVKETGTGSTGWTAK